MSDENKKLEEVVGGENANNNENKGAGGQSQENGENKINISEKYSGLAITTLEYQQKFLSVSTYQKPLSDNLRIPLPNTMVGKIQRNIKRLITKTAKINSIILFLNLILK